MALHEFETCWQWLKLDGHHCTIGLLTIQRKQNSKDWVYRMIARQFADEISKPLDPTGDWKIAISDSRTFE